MAIECTPEALLEGSKCFRCMDDQGPMSIYLLCLIVNGGEIPTVTKEAFGNPDENWIFGDPSANFGFGADTI